MTAQQVPHALQPGASERGERRGRPLRVFFVHEHTLGHRTYVANLRAGLAPYTDLWITWLAVEDHSFARAARRVPGLRHHWSLWGSAQALLQLLRAGGATADVLVFRTQSIAQLAWPLMRRLPTILSLDATQTGLASLAAAYGNVPPGDTPYDRLVRWLNRRTYHAARALVSMSRWAARSLVTEYGVDPAAIVVNPDGVDVDYWQPRPAENRAAGPVRVLFVGGDFARKGGPLLLDALAQIDLPWELHLVTNATTLSVPPEHAGRIHVHRGLTSNAPELVALYASCDVFALPTRGDCYSMAAIEAMATGLPVICSDVGGIAEIVIDGETGFLIRPGDGVALQARLRTLLSDAGLRQRLGAAGRRRAETTFDLRARAATIHQLIWAVHLARLRQPARVAASEKGASR